MCHLEAGMIVRSTCHKLYLYPFKVLGTTQKHSCSFSKDRHFRTCVHTYSFINL